MRRMLFVVAAAIAGSAAALAVASPSTATQRPYTWFVPSATAVAGPNHTFTLSVGVVNMDVKNQLLGQLGLAHTGHVTVSLVGKDFGAGFQLPPMADIKLNAYPFPGSSWTWSALGKGVPGHAYGVKITVSHVPEGQPDPPSSTLLAATASVVVK